MKFGIGQPVRRVEDERFLRGKGQFSDDINMPGQSYIYFVRAPHAHAEIKSVDVSEARSAPGVLSVFTGPDLDADGIGGLPCAAPVENRDGSAMALPRYPVLALGRVRHVGEAVAAVVAETPDAARDGAELVLVDYMPLPAIPDTAAALNPGVPAIWPDEAPGNLSFDWELGNTAAVDAGFRSASHVAEVRIVNNRVAPSSIEPRSAIGEFDPGQEKYTLRTGSQSSHMLRDGLAQPVLGEAFTMASLDGGIEDAENLFESDDETTYGEESLL